VKPIAKRPRLDDTSLLALLDMELQANYILTEVNTADKVAAY